MPLDWEVDIGPRDIVLDMDPAPPQMGTALQFSAHVCCGQMARWIKMPLGTEVGLGPGDIVLDGDLAELRPPKGAQQPPLFGPCLLWPNGRPSQLLLSTCLLSFLANSRSRLLFAVARLSVVCHRYSGG